MMLPAMSPAMRGTTAKRTHGRDLPARGGAAVSGANVRSIMPPSFVMNGVDKEGFGPSFTLCWRVPPGALAVERAAFPTGGYLSLRGKRPKLTCAPSDF